MREKLEKLMVEIYANRKIRRIKRIKTAFEDVMATYNVQPWWKRMIAKIKGL